MKFHSSIKLVSLSLGNIYSENELVHIMPLLENLRSLTFKYFGGDLSKLLPELKNLTTLHLYYYQNMDNKMVKHGEQYCSVY
jgi:hypothetical protein